MWLAILKEGGRSTAGEAAAMARAEVPPGPVLAQLVKNGALRRYEAPEGKRQGLRFGVTADCTVPLGVTIADILACKLTA